MVKYVAAIDSGTTSSRFFVFDTTGKVVAKAQKPFDLIHPHPGWTEADPNVILQTAHDCMKEVMDAGDMKVEDICSMGITNQRESVVAWDKTTGEPLYNSIIWLDLRTEGVVTELKKKIGDETWLRELTGLPISTYFSAVKLKWMFDNVPKVAQAAKDGNLMVGTIDAWLLYKLTGKHVTDVTNASRTMLMDLKTCQYSDKACEFFGIPKAILPKICSSSEVYGKCTSGACEGVPLAGVLGDQQAATLGQLCTKPGLAKNTYGTGCFMLMNTGDKPVPSKNGLLTTALWKLGDGKCQYALEGSIAIAGKGVNWLVNQLGIADSPEAVDELAASVKDTGGVTFVPAFSGLLAPYWRPDARGTIQGMTLATTKAHIARALFEAVCYQTAEVVEAMTADSGVKLTGLRVDGGMTKSQTTMQMQSDVLQVPVNRPSMAETTILGAAIAAGLAVGFWKSLDAAEAEIAKGVKLTTWKPSIKADEASGRLTKWKAAVQASLPLSVEEERKEEEKNTNTAEGIMGKPSTKPLSEVEDYEGACAGVCSTQ